MTDGKQQKAIPDQKKKSREKQDWAEQSGKNPDDLEIISEVRSRKSEAGKKI